MIKNIRKICIGFVLLYAVLTLFSIFVFDKDKEEVKWKLAQLSLIEELSFSKFDDWTLYNLFQQRTPWVSTTNDPIMMSPILEGKSAKQTYIRVQLTTASNQVQVFWKRKDEPFTEERSRVFKSGKTIELVVEGDVDQIRIDPAERPGLTLTVHQVQIKKYN